MTTAAVTVAVNDTRADYIVLPSEVRDQFTDPTLVRTRGQLIARCTVAGVMAGAIGIIEWPDNNDTPPTAAEAPSPTIATHDWIWHHFFFVPSGAACLALDFSDGGALGGRSIDSKAMRRLGGRKGILLVVSLLTGSAGALSYSWGIRCLLKD